MQQPALRNSVEMTSAEANNSKERGTRSSRQRQTELKDDCGCRDCGCLISA